MKKLLLIYFTLLLILIIPAIYVITAIANETRNIKTISQNVKLIDGNNNHNQALDVIYLAKRKGIKIPETIINFDTHSDIFLNMEINASYGAHIYDWINEYFAKNPEVKELYWVMPEKEVKNKLLSEIFVEKDMENEFGILYGNSLKSPQSINPDVDKTPLTQYFLINTKNSIMKEFIPEHDEKLLTAKNSPYRKVKVITCTKKTLPDFKDKQVFLSIDFDYISNSGFDTIEDFKNNRTALGIKIEINKMLKTIVRKNICPQIISLTLSPYYVPKEDEMIVYNFIQKFIKQSGHPDELQEYIHEARVRRVQNGEEKYKSF